QHRIWNEGKIKPKASINILSGSGKRRQVRRSTEFREQSQNSNSNRDQLYSSVSITLNNLTFGREKVPKKAPKEKKRTALYRYESIIRRRRIQQGIFFLNLLKTWNYSWTHFSANFFAVRGKLSRLNSRGLPLLQQVRRAASIKTVAGEVALRRSGSGGQTIQHWQREFLMAHWVSYLVAVESETSGRRAERIGKSKEKPRACARRGRLKLVGHTSALKFAGARTNPRSSLVAQWATVGVRKKYTSEKNMLLFTAENSNERRRYIAAFASRRDGKFTYQKTATSQIIHIIGYGVNYYTYILFKRYKLITSILGIKFRGQILCILRAHRIKLKKKRKGVKIDVFEEEKEEKEKASGIEDREGRLKTHKQPLISWHVVLYFHARSNLHTHTHTYTHIHGAQGIRRLLWVDELDLGDFKSDLTCEIIISLWILIYVHSVRKREMRRRVLTIDTQSSLKRVHFVDLERDLFSSGACKTSMTRSVSCCGTMNVVELVNTYGFGITVALSAISRVGGDDIKISYNYIVPKTAREKSRIIMALLTKVIRFDPLSYFINKLFMTTKGSRVQYQYLGVQSSIGTDGIEGETIIFYVMTELLVFVDDRCRASVCGTVQYSAKLHLSARILENRSQSHSGQCKFIRTSVHAFASHVYARLLLPLASEAKLQREGERTSEPFRGFRVYAKPLRVRNSLAARPELSLPNFLCCIITPPPPPRDAKPRASSLISLLIFVSRAGRIYASPSSTPHESSGYALFFSPLHRAPKDAGCRRMSIYTGERCARVYFATNRKPNEGRI
ncbi:unnamed protein product, partial [Trichogramma brassicae]